MADDPIPTPTEPQLQPGPSRTPDGTIIDQSTVKPETTPADTSTSKDSSNGQDTKTTFNKDTSKDVKEEDARPQGAPEKYADFKVPDGYKLDETVAGDATKMFKEANLPQDAAQKFVDFYIKQTQEAHEAPFKAFVDMTQGWKNDVAKTYGRDIEPGGKHFVAVGGLLSRLGPAESAFREAMDTTGVGSHPAFVAAFIKLAEMLGEGSHVSGNNPSPLGQKAPGADSRPSLAQAMYPNLPSSG